MPNRVFLGNFWAHFYAFLYAYHEFNSVLVTIKEICQLLFNFLTNYQFSLTKKLNASFLVD